jgi:protein-L-isoaspartate(D-aspartate) O-methyltransferase
MSKVVSNMYNHFKKPISNQQLIENLQHNSVLNTPAIIRAINDVDRKNFVKVSDQDKAYFDIPLDIGAEQTISQPYSVVFMLELLNIENGNNILDIGSGSCWSTCLLAHLTGKDGRVDATEIIPELYSFGNKNINKSKFSNITNHLVDTCTLGLPGEKFDRILVSAEATSLPEVLLTQLNPEGIIVIPIAKGILRIIKTNETEYKTERYEGFSFVPLVVEN